MGSCWYWFADDVVCFAAILLGSELAIQRGRWLILVFAVALVGMITPFHLYLCYVFLLSYLPLRLFGQYGWQPQLVISDLAMPNADGLQLCTRIRKTSTVPIIVLSVKGEERTKVEALDCGADDYVTKPFGIDELLARVRAALRRSGGDTEMSSLEAGEFLIDFDGRFHRRRYWRHVR